MPLARLPSGAQHLTIPLTAEEWVGFLSEWGLLPAVAVRALVLGWIMEGWGPTRLWIISGRRSQAEQTRLRSLFERGELRHRPAEDSLHLLGRAFDVGTDRVMTPREWETIGLVAEAIGLRWGGRFREPDRPHMDLSGDLR